MSENRLSNISQVFLGFGLLFLALKEFQMFLRPFVISVILSFLFVPFTRLSREKKRSIWLSTIGVIVSIFVVGTIISGFIFTGSEDVKEIPKETKITQNLENFLSKFSVNLGPEQVSLNEFFNPEKISQLISYFLSLFLSSLGTFFSEFLLVILFLIFLLPSHDSTVDKIAKKMDRDSRKKFLLALNQIEHNIRTYLSIKAFVSLITAILSGIVMMIFNVKFAILFMILIFMLNFIPSLGSISAVLIVLTSEILTQGFSFSFIILAILLITIQVIIGNIIEPKVSGKELELSPIVILLSLFFWGAVWGIGGALLAVPLTSIIKIILQHIDATKKIVPFIS